MNTLTMRAGQTGRLTFSITPAGEYTLAGAVRVNGQNIPLTAAGQDLCIPALPPGLHLLEVRANGRTVVYGGLEVQPSPMENVSGEVVWAINVDLAETIAHLHITLSEGPQGEQGASAYEIACAHGYTGTEAEWLASLSPWEKDLQTAVESALYTQNATLSTPAGTGNSYAHFIELDAQHVPIGRLTSITLQQRTGNNPATYSYLGVWEQSEDGDWDYRGSSANAPGQSVSAPSTWQFSGITLHGRPVRILAQATPSSTWETDPYIGLRVSPTPSGDTSTYTYNNNTVYAYLPQLEITYKALAATATLATPAPYIHLPTSTAQLAIPPSALRQGGLLIIDLRQLFNDSTALLYSRQLLPPDSLPAGMSCSMSVLIEGINQLTTDVNDRALINSSLSTAQGGVCLAGQLIISNWDNYFPINWILHTMIY